MPFPWKKNRVTRISQIVADLQTPKRGGSLVVETGFPTSLIDLFVKNRNRFKKNKFKKPLHSELPDPPPPPPSPETYPTSMPEPPSPTVLLSESPEPIPLIKETADGASVSGRVRECGSRSRVVLVLVKTLVVVVLVASVEKLTVGITLSAFALLFLEYAGKRVVSFLGPCSDASVAIESIFRNLLLLPPLKTKKECEPAAVQCGEVELRSNSKKIGEIEIVEANEITMLEDDSAKGKVLEACLFEISECKMRGGSLSGRFKSKMVKKLVPKKFRGSKKEKKEKGSKIIEAESGSEVSSALEEDKSPNFEIEEEVEDNGKEEENEVECGITCCQESLVDVSNEVKRIDRVGNSGYIILVIIVLAGLVAGRFQALVLTMTWCLLLKIVKVVCKSQIKCSVPNT